MIVLSVCFPLLVSAFDIIIINRQSLKYQRFTLSGGKIMKYQRFTLSGGKIMKHQRFTLSDGKIKKYQWFILSGGKIKGFKTSFKPINFRICPFSQHGNIIIWPVCILPSSNIWIRNSIHQLQSSIIWLRNSSVWTPILQLFILF